MAFLWKIVQYIRARPKRFGTLLFLLSLLLAYKKKAHLLLFSKIQQQVLKNLEKKLRANALQKEKSDFLQETLSGLLHAFDIEMKPQNKRTLKEFFSKEIRLSECFDSLKSLSLTSEQKKVIWMNIKLKAFQQAQLVILYEPYLNILSILSHLVFLIHDPEVKALSETAQTILKQTTERIFQKVEWECASHCLASVQQRFDSKLRGISLTTPNSPVSFETVLKDIVHFMTQILPFEKDLLPVSFWEKEAKNSQRFLSLVRVVKSFKEKLRSLGQNLNLVYRPVYIEPKLLHLNIELLRKYKETSQMKDTEMISRFSLYTEYERLSNQNIPGKLSENSPVDSYSKAEYDLEKVVALIQRVVGETMECMMSADVQIILREMVFLQLKKFSNRVFLSQSKGQFTAKGNLAKQIALFSKLLDEEFLDEASREQTQTFYQVRIKKMINFVKREKEASRSSEEAKSEDKNSQNESIGSNKNEKSIEMTRDELVVNLNVLREFMNLHHTELGLNEFLRKIYLGPAFERYSKSTTSSSQQESSNGGELLSLLEKS